MPDDGQEKQIREALAAPGRPGFHKVGAQFGVATGTVQRIRGAGGGMTALLAAVWLPPANAQVAHLDSARFLDLLGASLS